KTLGLLAVFRTWDRERDKGIGGFKSVQRRYRRAGSTHHSLPIKYAIKTYNSAIAKSELRCRIALTSPFSSSTNFAPANISRKCRISETLSIKQRSVRKGITISKSEAREESLNIFSILIESIRFLNRIKSLTLKAVVFP